MKDPITVTDCTFRYCHWTFDIWTLVNEPARGHPLCHVVTNRQVIMILSLFSLFLPFQECEVAADDGQQAEYTLTNANK